MECPLCQSQIEETNEVFKCKNKIYNRETKGNEGCTFQLWKKQFGTVLTIEDIEELLKNGVIFKSNLVNQKGMAYAANLHLSKECNRLEISFPDTKKFLPNQDNIIVFEKGYKKGEDIIWKKFSQTEITYDEALKLFNGEKIEKNLINKLGNEYTGILSFNSGKIDMIFK